jgi:hypothetical protein
MNKLPELDRLSEPEKDALIAALWAEVQRLKARLEGLEAKVHEPRKDDEVESGRHMWLTPHGLPEALPKPDKPLSWHPAIPRHHPLPRAMGFSVSFGLAA